MKRKIICVILVLTLVCFGINVGANELTIVERNDTTTVRATGRFSMEVPAKTAVKANSTFPLEVGEVVTIKASYTPFSANVDFGLVAPDGLFYSVNATDGSIDQGIRVSQKGYYTLAVRNNSSQAIHVSGYVNY